MVKFAADKDEPRILSDREITELVIEPKSLPRDMATLVRLTRRGASRRSDFDVVGTKGNQFTVHLRQSVIDSADFSAILSYEIDRTNIAVRLRRYNGKAHKHRNALERGPEFFDFHIHMATERYQKARGRDPEGYAEPTSRYTDLHGAFNCLLEDCGFILVPNPQADLWSMVAP